jgi:hypothetical protein
LGGPGRVVATRDLIPKLTWAYNSYFSIAVFTMLRSFVVNWRHRKRIPPAIPGIGDRVV